MCLPGGDLTALFDITDQLSNRSGYINLADNGT